MIHVKLIMSIKNVTHDELGVLWNDKSKYQALECVVKNIYIIRLFMSKSFEGCLLLNDTRFYIDNTSLCLKVHFLISFLYVNFIDLYTIYIFTQTLMFYFLIKLLQEQARLKYT